MFSILKENIRHRNQGRTNRSQNSQGISNTQVFIKRQRHLDHPSRSYVSDHRDGSEGTCGVRLVTINDVLVAGDEDADDSVAE